MADTAVAGPLARIEPQLATEVIANQRFIRQLDELRKLKEFLFEEKIQFKEEDLDVIDLEELNNLSYSPTGRVPNAGEWRTLDEKLAKLASYLSDDLRRKIRLRELSLFFKILPICFLAFSVISTILYLVLPYFSSSRRFTIAYIVMGNHRVGVGDQPRRVGRLRVFRHIGYHQKLASR